MLVDISRTYRDRSSSSYQRYLLFDAAMGGRMTFEMRADAQSFKFDAAALSDTNGPAAIQYSGGSEFLVNTATPNTQLYPAIAALVHGQFVVIWSDNSGQGGDTSLYGVKAQIFDSTGQKVGFEFLVNTTTAENQYSGSITALSTGGFVVTWRDGSKQGGDASGPSIKAQIFGADGTKVGSEFLVNTATYSNQLAPDITALSTGGFVVVWADQSGEGADGNNTAVKGQIYAANGTRLGDEFLINSTIEAAQEDPVVSSLASGGFVVTWTDWSQANVSGCAIKGQLFDSHGSKIGTEFLINAEAANYQKLSSISALSSGGFVVTWADNSGLGGDASGYGIKGQIFDANGNKLGTEFLVNTETLNDQNTPNVRGLANGGFVVTWTDLSGLGGDASGRSIKAQVFDASGNKSGAEFLVNVQTLNDQVDPAVAALANGDFTIVWRDNSLQGGDASGSSIKARTFSPPAPAAVTLTGTSADDVMSGGSGDDFIDGAAGRDRIRGGDGADHMIGGADNDEILGEAGDDLIGGQDGDDYIDGGSGRNRVYGDGGRDHIVGGLEQDSLFGQEGEDLIWGRGGDDFIDGGGFNDELYGEAGHDHIIGGSGDDRVAGQEGDDLIGGQDGQDFIDGGAGNDRLYGDDGNDHMIGGSENDSLLGQAGEDLIGGQEGDDFIDGGIGADRLYGDGGNDHMIGGSENDRLFGQDGDDLIGGQDGDDFIDGGAGRDTLYGDAGDDIIQGGAGADDLHGQAGADRFVFAGIGDSPAGAADRILDFDRAAGDLIDLSALDANSDTFEDDAFTFVGSSAFSNKAGELRYEIVEGQVRLFADVNGDGVADMSIVVIGNAIEATDFIL